MRRNEPHSSMSNWCMFERILPATPTLVVGISLFALGLCNICSIYSLIIVPLQVFACRSPSSGCWMRTKVPTYCSQYDLPSTVCLYFVRYVTWETCRLPCAPLLHEKTKFSRNRSFRNLDLSDLRRKKWSSQPLAKQNCIAAIQEWMIKCQFQHVFTVFYMVYILRWRSHNLQPLIKDAWNDVGLTLNTTYRFVDLKSTKSPQNPKKCVEVKSLSTRAPLSPWQHFHRCHDTWPYRAALKPSVLARLTKLPWEVMELSEGSQFPHIWLGNRVSGHWGFCFFVKEMPISWRDESLKSRSKS